jgi:hypothetical protein
MNGYNVPAWMNWLLGLRTVGIQCESCNWENEETDCEDCNGTGIIIFKTFIAEKLKETLKVCWIK